MLMAILTGLTFTLLVTRRPGVGKVVWEFGPEHGIHLGDIPVAGVWVLGMVCLVLLWRDDTHR